MRSATTGTDTQRGCGRGMVAGEPDAGKAGLSGSGTRHEETGTTNAGHRASCRRSSLVDVEIVSARQSLGCSAWPVGPARHAVIQDVAGVRERVRRVAPNADAQFAGRGAARRLEFVVCQAVARSSMLESHEGRRV